MKRKTKLKYALIAFVVALFISQAVRRAPVVEMTLQDPSEVVSDEAVESDDLQGVWRYAIDGGEDQLIQIRGNSLIITDQMNGSVYYSITGINKVTDFKATDDVPDGIDLYEIDWSVEDYIARYGDSEYSVEEGAEPFYYYYDSDEDILYTSKDVAYYRDDVWEMLVVYRDNLCSLEPINETQLDEFSDDELIDYILTVQEKGNNQEESIHELYMLLTQDSKGKNLLVDKDYEEYMQIVKEITRNTTLTLKEINEANPSAVLAWYRTALAEFGGKRSREIIAHIEPRIHGARQDYLNQRVEGENALRKK